MGVIEWIQLSEFKTTAPTQSGYYLVAEGAGDDLDKELGHHLAVLWYNAQSLEFEYPSGGKFRVLDEDASYVIKIPNCKNIEKFYHFPKFTLKD